MLILCSEVLPLEAQPRPLHFYLVVVPGLHTNDLTRPELPALTTYLQKGAGGFLVSRTARVSLPTRPLSSTDLRAAQMLTLGSGARADAENVSAGGDKAQKTDGVKIGAFRISPILLASLKASNARLDHPVMLGKLATLMEAQGSATVLIGAFDDEQQVLPSALLAMNQHGEVATLMNLSSDATGRQQAPHWADVPRYLAALPSRARLIVISFHELEDADSSHVPGSGRTTRRTVALQRLNTLLVALLPLLSENSPNAPTRWLLLSPGPTDPEKERFDRLAPAVYGGSDVAPGLLASPSTRRGGLGVSTDVLPTVAEFFHAALPPGVSGRSFAVVPGSAPLTPIRLRDLHDRLVTTSRLQNALGGLPTVQMLLVLAGSLALVSKRSRRDVTLLASGTAFAVAALPLGLLILPPVAPRSLFGASLVLAAFVCVAALLGGCLARSPQNSLRGFHILCAVFVAILGLDLLTGRHLLEGAWMSYSVMEGARYYGIGNEYMGALIGAACVLPIVPASFLVLPLLIAAMGLGRFGAKVGAIPSAGLSFGALALVALRGRIRKRDAVFGLLIAMGLLVLFALVDARTSVGGQTHFVRAVSGQGGGSLFGIAQRKLLLEGHLLLHSVWSLTLLACIASLLFLRRTFPTIFAFRDDAEGRMRRARWTGILAGASASLMCNDSGVTAATLILLYAWAWTAIQAIQSEQSISS